MSVCLYQKQRPSENSEGLFRRLCNCRKSSIDKGSINECIHCNCATDHISPNMTKKEKSEGYDKLHLKSFLTENGVGNVLRHNKGLALV